MFSEYRFPCWDACWSNLDFSVSSPILASVFRKYTFQLVLAISLCHLGVWMCRWEYAAYAVNFWGWCQHSWFWSEYKSNSLVGNEMWWQVTILGKGQVTSAPVKNVHFLPASKFKNRPFIDDDPRSEGLWWKLRFSFSRYYLIGLCDGFNCVPPKCLCWNPNLQDLRMWPYLAIGSL